MEHRVSSSQIEVLLDFLDSHPAVAKGIGLGCRSKGNLEKEWDKLAITLNAHGEGSTKSGKRWKRYWADLKHKTKSRAAERRRSANATGGGPPDNGDLGITDQRILAIIGEPAVFGDVQHKVPAFPPLSVGQRAEDNDIELTKNDDEITVEVSDLEELHIINSPSNRGHTSKNSTVEVHASPAVLCGDQQQNRDRSPLSMQRGPRRPRQIAPRRLTAPSTQFIKENSWVVELEQRRVAAEEKAAQSKIIIAEAARVNSESARIIAESIKMFVTLMSNYIESKK